MMQERKNVLDTQIVEFLLIFNLYNHCCMAVTLKPGTTLEYVTPHILCKKYQKLKYLLLSQEFIVEQICANVQTIFFDLILFFFNFEKVRNCTFK